MTTKYLCDHRNCTVEMVIGPMKNPVNHKQQGMLGTVQIQDVFCRKCIKPSCKISTLNNLYYDHAQNYSTQIKSIANETKRHVHIQVYVQALFTFLPRNKQNEH